jgi:hypothetical protein
MERFDVHVESQETLTTKDTKNTEKIMFRLHDLYDLGDENPGRKVGDGDPPSQRFGAARGAITNTRGACEPRNESSVSKAQL